MATAQQVMHWKLDAFNAQLKEVAKRTNKSARSIVGTNSRRLLRKFSYKCPILTGRARAGFWPAAIALNMTSLNTPYPNHGEGRGIVKMYDRYRPSVLIGNRVPYIHNAGGRGLGWWLSSINLIMARMEKDITTAVPRQWWL